MSHSTDPLCANAHERLADQIIDNTIDLEPEYQRGAILAHAQLQPAADRIIYARHRLDGGEAIRLDRLDPEELLHPPCHIR